ncbi:MAG: phosphate ABC transporter substrate-binding protein [Symploca sp. SIO2D2]|nr:phosphate ABC transporter substrate-binding protein [Symploca sp. SIO2D2]
MTNNKNETVTLILALLITAALLGGGVWWLFNQKPDANVSDVGNDSSNNNQNQQPQPTETAPPTDSNIAFPPPTNVPAGTTVRIAGSTSMVQINRALKNTFEQQFPGTTIDAKAGGTDQGIQSVLQGGAELAAISRPLTPEEGNQGLVAVTVTEDEIAVVVGRDNTFQKGLTRDEVVGIFTGRVTDWSEVGGSPGTIRVINRPAFSGTHQAFQELALNGGNFGTTPNITTLEEDATTPLLRALGTDGIGYATYAQVANQQTVRTVAVDGLTPEAATYPYQRTLAYVYQEPASPQVQAFLGYVASPKGQQAILKSLQ